MSDQKPAGLMLVPFNEKWISHDKLDLHAIYKRPVYREDEFGEPQRVYDKDGIEEWDLTPPLPVKQHNVWRGKGFQYVTLADRESLIMAAKNNTILGETPARAYDQHRTGGPWNYRLYLQGQIGERSKQAEQLKQDVYRFGSVAVEEIRRRTEPEFTLPPSLRDIQPEGYQPPAKRNAKESAA